MLLLALLQRFLLLDNLVLGNDGTGILDSADLFKRCVALGAQSNQRALPRRYLLNFLLVGVRSLQLRAGRHLEFFLSRFLCRRRLSGRDLGMRRLQQERKVGGAFSHDFFLPTPFYGCSGATTLESSYSESYRPLSSDEAGGT